MTGTLKKIKIKELMQGIYGVDEEHHIKRCFDCNNFGKAIDPKDEKYNQYGGDPDTLGLYVMNGEVCVRPPYQRDFVWTPEKSCKFIEAIHKGTTIDGIRFADVSAKNLPYKYEVVDGQQRIYTICKYLSGHITLPKTSSFKGKYHEHDMTDFLNQELFITILKFDNDIDKIEYFENINESNYILTAQEIRNAVYYGPFVEALRAAFGPRCTKTCKASKRGWDKKYVSFPKNYDLKRQGLTELALEWHILKEDFYSTKTLYNKLKIKSTDHKFTYELMNSAIRDYMNKHQQDSNCNDVWNTFEEIHNWIDSIFGYFPQTKTFSHIATILKNVKNWAWIYFTYKDYNFPTAVVIDNVKKLFENTNEYRNCFNIFEYVLLCLSTDENEREKVARENLNLLDGHSFSTTLRNSKYNEQHGLCARCGKHFDISEMDAHHVISWKKGGRTILMNCEMLCHNCHNAAHNY